MVAIAVRHRNLLLSEQPQRSAEYHLDNRICWALSVAEIAQDHPWAVLPVHGYLSWMDGTGSVERWLGTHASVLACHAGQRSQKLAEMQLEKLDWTSPGDANEVCVEVRLEGPSSSSEIRYADRHGAYRAGEFALECAALWIAVRGRRFGCYKLRSDAGVQKSKSKLGTFSFQRKSQLKALDSIAVGGESSWFVGAKRADLKKKGNVARADQSKRLRDFNEKTKQLRIQKDEVALWRGFNMTPSALRRNASAIQQSLASSQTQASSSSDSNATFVEQPLLAIHTSVGFDKRRRYKDITAGALNSATLRHFTGKVDRVVACHCNGKIRCRSGVREQNAVFARNRSSRSEVALHGDFQNKKRPVLPNLHVASSN